MSESDNIKIWDSLSKTDPAQTKKFARSGGFKGTAIKPIYTTKKMTDEFGPAGQGWGMGKPEFEVVQGVNHEAMVYCTVALWWRDKSNIIYGVGGDKITTHIKANEQYNRPERWENDDEAFKKAFTDAMGNAMKHIGMSADVHMGLFDDSKYVSEREAEERADKHIDATEPVKSSPKAVMRPIDKEMRTEIEACQTVEELTGLWRSAPFQAEYAKLPKDWQEALVELMAETKAGLAAAPARAGYVAPRFE